MYLHHLTFYEERTIVTEDVFRGSHLRKNKRHGSSIQKND